MDENRLSQLALHFIPGIGNFIVKQLVSYSGSAENVFKLTKAQLKKIPGIGPATADAIYHNKPFVEAEQELKRAEKEGARLLLYSDREFPTRLKHINDAPSLLYYKGTADLNAKKIVSIVGTRNATKYGKDIVSELIQGLKNHSALIVSGLAYGIDIHAHKCSLQHGLPTIGVMASGIDIIYPALHRDTARAMVHNGGLLTENSLGSQPEAPKFPARNRIIAGMSDAVVVIEAARRGGALITAEIANDYNKDVFAVPGNIHSPFSEGCNNLIKKNKAHLLTGIGDLEYIMNWLDDKIEQENAASLADLSSLDQDEVRVFTALKEHTNPILIDNLSWKTDLPVNKLASILLNLEFKGLVHSLPGKSYKLVN